MRNYTEARTLLYGESSDDFDVGFANFHREDIKIRESRSCQMHESLQV